METETVIAVARQVPTDVGVVAMGNGFLAAWSAEGGTWFARLDIAGRMVAAATRVQPGISDVSHGVSGTVSPKTFWPPSERSSVISEDLHLVPLGPRRAALLMLALPDDRDPGGAYVTILGPGDTTRSPVVRLGPAGEYGTRITGVVADGDLVVAWHDGGLASSVLRIVRLSVNGLTVEREAVEAGNGIVASPVLVRVGDRTMLAWSETERNEQHPESLVNIASVSSSLSLSARSTVARSRFLYPSPDMSVMGDRVGLTFRDDADRDDTPEYHFMVLGPTGKTVSKRRRISQADGFRGPSLTSSGGIFLGATIRSFQRNLLIGLNRFNAGGTKLGGEFQVYADKSDFVRVDASHNGDTLLLVYAEDRRSSGRVLTGQVMCRNDG